MKNIVISMQNILLSGAMVRALRETGNFRPKGVLPDWVGNTAVLCQAADAQVLVMEVGRQRDFSLDARLSVVDTLKRTLPGCRTALLCDENADPDIAEDVKAAKQNGRIDAFFYASVTAAYLAAMLNAL